MRREMMSFSFLERKHKTNWKKKKRNTENFWLER
jgi:hypothetical protein